ncbi:MAG: M48 family metallopeptidase [Candidatus Pelagadaptatus aseana]|uniref:M48 family metalloprotease n=1 Tax=Candidatus Pelagadaptatus aseana TaxID=3120508 RepID=UPI0039B140EC
MTLRLTAIILSLTLWLSGCSVNPVTGEQQLSIISPAQEVSMGTKQYAPSQQTQGGRYTVDPDLTVYVNRIGQQLAEVSHRPGLPYEFVVLNNDVPNAWALPGGKIAINRGLLTELEDEAQLAAVLAHEIVHAAARHSATQMTQSMLLGVGTQLVQIATQSNEYGQLAGLGAQLGAGLYQAHYGRDQELEADAYGIEYMILAGYDPAAAVELQQTFVRLSESRQSNWLEGLFASHPPSQQRVDANRQHAAAVRGGIRNKAAFQRAMAQVNRDQAAYELHQQAVAAAAQEDFSKARSLTQQAIDKQPKEPLFWITKGRLALQNQTFKTANTAFTRAHQLHPEYFMPLLGKGIAGKHLKRYQQADQDLMASLQILPTQSAVYYLGETKLALGQKQEAIKYFQEAAKGGGNLGKNANAQLEKLLPKPTAPQNQ